MKICLGGLEHAAVVKLLREHREQMFATSPADSCHVLDLNELKHPSIRFYSSWQGDELAGCAALKVHDEHLGEIKSMKTALHFTRQGVAAGLLDHLIVLGVEMGLQQLKLETGALPYFEPAVALYRKYGFVDCAPFADYRHDPYSLYMALALPPRTAR